MPSISITNVTAAFDLPEHPPTKAESSTEPSANQGDQSKSPPSASSATELPIVDLHAQETQANQKFTVTGEKWYQIPGAFPTSVLSDSELISTFHLATTKPLPAGTTTTDDTITLLLSHNPIRVSKSVLTSRIPFFDTMFSGLDHDLITAQFVLTRIPISCIDQFSILISWAEDGYLAPMTTEGKKEWNFNPVHLSSLAHLLSIPELESLVLNDLKTAYEKNEKMEDLEHIRSAFEMTPPEGMLCQYLSKLLAWIIVGFEDKDDSPFSNAAIQKVLKSNDDLMVQVMSHLRGIAAKGIPPAPENEGNNINNGEEIGKAKHSGGQGEDAYVKWKLAQEQYLRMEGDNKMENDENGGDATLEEESQGNTKEGNEDHFPLPRMKGILRNW